MLVRRVTESNTQAILGPQRRKYVSSFYSLWPTTYGFDDKCPGKMYLYSCTARDFKFLLTFFLTLCIQYLLVNIAVPSIMKNTQINAETVLAKSTKYEYSIGTGPYIIRTVPYYQLWVTATMSLNGTYEQETFNTSVQVKIAIDNLEEGISSANYLSNRVESMECIEGFCELPLHHFKMLEHTEHIIRLKLFDMESFYKKYEVQDIKFNLLTYNVSYAIYHHVFRVIYFVVAIINTCWFYNRLVTFSVDNDHWSVEQKWVMVLLPMLAFTYNSPFSLVSLIAQTTWSFDCLIGVSQLLFVCLEGLFWMCMLQGLRQRCRPFSTFYLPRFAAILFYGICSAARTFYEFRKKDTNGKVDESSAILVNNFYSVASFICSAYIAIPLIALLFDTVTMRYINKRVKFLSITSITQMIILVTVPFVWSYVNTIGLDRVPAGPLTDSFTNMRNIGIHNLYIYIMSWYYQPPSLPLFTVAGEGERWHKVLLRKFPLFILTTFEFALGNNTDVVAIRKKTDTIVHARPPLNKRTQRLMNIIRNFYGYNGKDFIFKFSGEYPIIGEPPFDDDDCILYDIRYIANKLNQWPGRFHVPLTIEANWLACLSQDKTSVILQELDKFDGSVIEYDNIQAFTCTLDFMPELPFVILSDKDENRCCCIFDERTTEVYEEWKTAVHYQLTDGFVLGLIPKCDTEVVCVIFNAGRAKVQIAVPS